MAKAYLGKISALVTANTSDFNSKLNASAQQVGNFARAMQTQLTRAENTATASLRNIYTESQKVSRALQAAASQRLKFKGYDTSTFESLTKAIDQFKALQQAAVAVNEPLSRAARSVENLSASVQLGFDPALKSAQKSAEYLSAALARGGVVGERSFERIERRAIAAAQAADRLAEAAQMASAGPRGTELAFAAPRVRDSLAASADVRQRAAAAPASVLEGGRVANDVQKLVAIDNLIQKRRAEIESGTILNIDTTRAQASLESLLQISARVRAQVNAAIGGGGADADTASLINRARAQRDYYEESERLANQAASDAAAPLIARARAEREFYEESRRLASQAAADAAAPLIARAQAEREFYEESERLRRQAAADSAAVADREVAPLINRARAERDSQLDFGLDLDAPRRQIEVLRGSIVSLKGQLDTLPAGLRSRFIPAIAAAQQELERLASLPAATTAELSRASREVERLSQAFNRARQAANIPSFKQFTRDLATQQAVGELQALQQILARVGAQAGGPAAQAYDVYRKRLQQAIRTGTAGLPTVRRELELLQETAARAAAATGKISFNAALREIRRGGDIARGSFNNLSLATQQAAFAIDDFFSVQGDFTQRLRAVQNNVTQLAFIIGGTKGLFIGLGVAIAAQAGVALLSWVNGGRTAEDQTKALNDAISRQKSLVESLAEAWKSLGDELSRGTLSPLADEAQRISEQIDDIAKKQREGRDRRIADADPFVRTERAEQQRLQREIEGSGDFAQRVGLEEQLRQSRDREARRRRALSVLPAPDANEVEQTLRRRAPNPFRNNVPNLPEGQSVDALRARRDALDEPLKKLREILADGPSFLDGGLRFNIAAESFDQLNSLAERLNAAIEAASDAFAIDAVRGAELAGRSISDAQDAVAEAIKQSVPYARQFGIAVDQVGLAFREAFSAFEAAASIADPAERQAAQEEAATKLRDAEAQAAALKNQTQGITVATSAVQRFAEALDRSRQEVEQNLQQAQSNADATRRADLGRSTPDSRKARDAAESQLRDQQAAKVRVEQEIARAREVFGQQAAQFGTTKDRAGRATRLLRAGDEFNRLREGAGIERAGGETIEDVIAKARRRGLDAVADALQKQADIISQGAKTFPTWDDAELAVAEYESTIQSFTGKIASSLDRISQIDKQLASAGVLPQEARDALIAERAALENSVIEQSEGVKRARDASTQLAEQAASADRGDVLQQTPGERAAKDLEQQIADIRESASRAAENSSGMPEDIEKIRKRMNEAIGRAEEDMMRQIAPVTMGLMDSVQNAVLQGPSRAALNASDVTTMQGAQELNRLLRGDDPARDVDMVALQKEANAILERIAQKQNPVAN